MRELADEPRPERSAGGHVSLPFSCRRIAASQQATRWAEGDSCIGVSAVHHRTSSSSGIKCPHGNIPADSAKNRRRMPGTE